MSLEPPNLLCRRKHNGFDDIDVESPYRRGVRAVSAGERGRRKVDISYGRAPFGAQNLVPGDQDSVMRVGIPGRNPPPLAVTAALK